MNNQEFINTLVTVFPEIKDDVLDEDNDGLINLQIGYFRRLAQKAIDDNNVFNIKKCFQFVDDNIEDVEYKVENALYLSFLNKLDFAGNLKAEKLLPKKLLNAKRDLDNYENSKETNVKMNKFLDNL